MKLQTEELFGNNMVLQQQYAGSVYYQMEIRFAKIAYYEINLYNKADIPVKPFCVRVQAGEK